MAEYFLCLDAATFLRDIRPALAAAWQQRSFLPCRALCTDFLSAAQDYTRRYHVGDEETLVARVADGLAFDRSWWRLLVSEILLFAAAEIPEFPTNAATLCCLLAPGQGHHGDILREQYAPIHQVLWGSRDLTFGGAVYRPEHAGYNDVEDVARLATYLSELRPEEWSIDDLRGLPDVEDEDDRADELAFIREWFPVLIELYQRTQARGRVLVIECIY